MWVVYILRLADNSLYTGITNNLKKRLNAHISGKGSKYVRSRLPFSVLYLSGEPDRSSATKKEIKIKKMSKKEKEILVSKWFDKGEIKLFCESCGTVISITETDVDLSKFSMNCLVCNNIISYDADNENCEQGGR